MSTPSKTPLTDAAWPNWSIVHEARDFARELELKLAEKTEALRVSEMTVGVLRELNNKLGNDIAALKGRIDPDTSAW